MLEVEIMLDVRACEYKEADDLKNITSKDSGTACSTWLYKQ